jgi:hypothetical protein
MRPYKTDVITSEESVAYSKREKCSSIERLHSMNDSYQPQLPNYIRDQFYKPSENLHPPMELRLISPHREVFSVEDVDDLFINCYYI